ncbi:hypothetical protein FSP39_018938 [Pinctada imbricata]|uniref:Nischarin n=1 Tax=Pinctada imbricata TaxID=66713 RepID=A0AA89C846_PINIB|nr:hypothetical protein FSP39_018938 [Pinctada imbricata]
MRTREIKFKRRSLPRNAGELTANSAVTNVLIQNNANTSGVCSQNRQSLLPPKKLFGNQSEAFIRKRQNDLEVYLQTVLYFVAHKMPPSLAAFLSFDRYEIHGITQCMAEELYNKGDQWLQTRDKYIVTPLQLYSLTERLKLPEPTCDSGDVKKDLGHILDFITRVKGLKVKGSKTPVGTSNIDLTQLKFDISLFKSLNCLELEYCLAANVLGIESAKESLERVALNYGSDQLGYEILLHDIPQWKAENGTLLVSYWENLVEVDLSHNTIREIDDSVQLMPRVEVLDLSHNLLQSIQHLNWLSQLTHLDLSHNTLSNLDALHTKLGNLKILNLAGNKLDSLKGLAKLFSLENLDVRDNRISQIPEVSLDGQKPTQKELDTVAVLQAIQKSKEKAKKPMQRKSENTAERKDSKSSEGDEPFVSRPQSQRQRFRTVLQDSQTNTSSVSVCSLPDQQDKEFMTWLHTRLFGAVTDGMDVQENVVNVLWCTALQFSQPDTVVPCCVVLTERRVFVLRLRKGDSGYKDVPCLETFYILPLSNVQEIIIGPCYSYIRLEESFVGASGTFVLMKYDSDVGKAFSDSLKSVYEGGDMGPSPILNCSENSDLGKHIFAGEDEEGLCTGRIAFSVIVKIAGVDQQSLLILSENKVYLVHTDCLFWPRPAFLSQLEDIQRPNFSYLQQHSLMTKISDIKMNITLKASSRSKKVSSIESSGPAVTYEQFGLSMVFHELIGPVGFHVWFLSVKSRDTFLDRLTTLRSEIAHRMSPTIREEPEGGNESADSSDSSDGSNDGNDELTESQTVAADADAETERKTVESSNENTENAIKR